MSESDQSIFESILQKKRGYISRWPDNGVAIMIVSGGLDSIITSARLISEYGITIYPLHIERGQTNFESERKSIDYFANFFEKHYPGKFKKPVFIKLNIPPIEIKSDLKEYTVKNGHPLRDTMLQMAATQYAVSLRSKGVSAKTIFCAVMPEDYFPHSNITSIRATNIAICQNLNDWEWSITSPNIDTHLDYGIMNKADEIKWAAENDIPSGKTVSCNDASKLTGYLNCGVCSSCERRKSAFNRAGVEDTTNYFNDAKH